MKKEQETTRAYSLNLFEENPVQEWFRNNGTKILYGLAAILGLITVLFWLNAGKQAKSEQDYIQAMIAMQHLSRYPRTDKEAELQQGALTDLLQIIQRHPELHAKYDGQLAEYFLLEKKPAEAQNFANNIFARTEKDHLPYYQEYAKNSLAITQQEFASALQNAIQMQEDMEKVGRESDVERGFGDDLYIFNLLRIAQLQHLLGNKAEEAQAWAQLTQLAENERNGIVNSRSIEEVLSHMDVEGVTLMNYINSQK